MKLFPHGNDAKFTSPLSDPIGSELAVKFSADLWKIISDR